MSAGGVGFLFDLNRCTGCNACELACSIENELGWGRSWRQVQTFNAARHPGVPSFHLSTACNHCAAAPCVPQCPALAIRRDAATDAVLIEAAKCIGCHYCSWVCPYDAPRFDAEAGVMGKCTFCNHRLAAGSEPACVEQCPTTALRFGPLQGEPLVPGFPDTAAQPALRFAPLRHALRPPESSWSLPEDVLAAFAAARPETRAPISLASEWPLLIFTLVAAGLVGWQSASSASGVPLHAGSFAGALGVALGTSLLHLGRKSRAWRALLNVRRSWLSREVAAFAGFAAVAGTQLWLAASWSRVTASLLGFAFLFCADRVYDPVRSGWRLHSADTLLTALLIASLLLGWGGAAFAVGGVKLALYAQRLLAGSRQSARAGTLVVAILRIGVGLALPALLALLRSDMPTVWLLLLVAVGETTDRIQFYQGLVVTTPRRELAELEERSIAQMTGGNA
ncbi:MAG: dimethyl sulfoxide reductase anchor subunit [Candidatus Latescibacterota bacterium]|nr:MAG: dimethyl sulfoxide reductase anchor subunit [Candidatus Latescibacterota bacterium]